MAKNQTAPLTHLVEISRETPDAMEKRERELRRGLPLALALVYQHVIPQLRPQPPPI